MAKTKMQLADWLDDLCVRFIINLPQEELESVERICFQVEEAQWFYEDFIRPLDPALPSMNLRKFSSVIFQHCPLLSNFGPQIHAQAFAEFLAYKTRVPVRGAIMLNEAMDEMVLVKGWKKSARWGFPRGKINKDENDLDCAVREVYEETGYDIRAAGLVMDESEQKYIEVIMREQHMRLYVFRGVPRDTHFEPRTRKEISAIDWYKVSELPAQKKQRYGQDTGQDDGPNHSNFYMVAPFLAALRRWIKQQKKEDRIRIPQSQKVQAGRAADVDELQLPEDSVALAGETTAEEDFTSDPGAYNTTEENHLNRLLAGLRGSDVVSSPSKAPEVAVVQNPVDPAAEIKRLLSVSGPSAPVTEPMNPLLAILRGNNPPTIQPHPATNTFPKTPLDQIADVPLQPHTPHHANPRPPQMGNTPVIQSPPQFPFSPIHQPNHGPFQQHQPLFPMPNPQYGNGMQPNVHQAFVQSPAGYPIPLNGPPQPQFSVHGAAIPQSIQQAPRPYHRTSDSQFVQTPQFLDAHGPAIPSASQLPTPKLNAHTLSLLNAFKNPEVAKAAIASHGQAKFAEVYNAGRSAQRQSLTEFPQVAPQIPLNSRQPPVQAPPSTDAMAPLMTAQKVSIPTVQPKPRSAQQEALLTLFRAPSTSVESPHYVPRAEALAAEPVELSAQPSPGMATINTLRSFEAAPSQPTKLSIPVLPSPDRIKVPGLTSATVSGPLNEPNFATLQKQRVSPHPMEANGKATGSATLSAAASIHATSSRSSPNVSAFTNPATSPSLAGSGLISKKQRGDVQAHSQQISPQQSFQQPIDNTQNHPQQVIHQQAFQQPNLRPRNQTTSPAAIPHFDRRDIAPEQQKNTLLSLFGKAQLSPGIASPVSPLPEKAMLRQGGDLPRSRMSSIASLSDGIKVETKNEAPQRPQGRQTPVTPVDKHILLGYLNAVARGN